jgi:hypothetical protein
MGSGVGVDAVLGIRNSRPSTPIISRTSTPTPTIRSIHSLVDIQPNANLASVDNGDNVVLGALQNRFLWVPPESVAATFVGMDPYEAAQQQTEAVKRLSGVNDGGAQVFTASPSPRLSKKPSRVAFQNDEFPSPLPITSLPPVPPLPAGIKSTHMNSPSPSVSSSAPMKPRAKSESESRPQIHHFLAEYNAFPMPNIGTSAAISSNSAIRSRAKSHEELRRAAIPSFVTPFAYSSDGSQASSVSEMGGIASSKSLHSADRKSAMLQVTPKSIIKNSAIHVSDSNVSAPQTPSNVSRPKSTSSQSNIVVGSMSSKAWVTAREGTVTIHMSDIYPGLPESTHKLVHGTESPVTPVSPPLEKRNPSFQDYMDSISTHYPEIVSPLPSSESSRGSNVVEGMEFNVARKDSSHVRSASAQNSMMDQSKAADVLMEMVSGDEGNYGDDNLTETYMTESSSASVAWIAPSAEATPRNAQVSSKNVLFDGTAEQSETLLVAPTSNENGNSTKAAALQTLRSLLEQTATPPSSPSVLKTTEDRESKSVKEAHESFSTPDRAPPSVTDFKTPLFTPPATAPSTPASTSHSHAHTHAHPHSQNSTAAAPPAKFLPQPPLPSQYSDEILAPTHFAIHAFSVPQQSMTFTHIKNVPMEVTQGDLIHVLHTYKDGWVKCMNLSHGKKVGVVPGGALKKMETLASRAESLGGHSAGGIEVVKSLSGKNGEESKSGGGEEGSAVVGESEEVKNKLKNRRKEIMRIPRRDDSLE